MIVGVAHSLAAKVFGMFAPWFEGSVEVCKSRRSGGRAAFVLASCFDVSWDHEAMTIYSVTCLADTHLTRGSDALEKLDQYYCTHYSPHSTGRSKSGRKSSSDFRQLLTSQVPYHSWT